MRPLNANDVLLLSERAATSHGVDRALLPLMVASPEQSRERLARLPIGRRDTLLLELYRSSFGTRLDLTVECPECGEDLELDLTTADLQVQADISLDNPVVELDDGGLQVRCRLPNSEDMAAASACCSATAGTQVLLERCLLEAYRNGEAIGADDLAPDEVAQLAAAIGEADPFAEILVELACIACDHRWQAQIDVAECLWPEIIASARSLLREVHTLARFYGWREADILGMSANRRRRYLEMVGA
jgi:hypothetical protein